MAVRGGNGKRSKRIFLMKDGACAYDRQSLNAWMLSKEKGMHLRPAGGDVDGRYYVKMTDTAKPDPDLFRIRVKLPMEGI